MSKYFRETLSFTPRQTKILDHVAGYKNASKAYIMRTAFDFWCDNLDPDWYGGNEYKEIDDLINKLF